MSEPIIPVNPPEQGTLKYQANSNKSREVAATERKLQAVVSRPVRQRTPVGRKFAEAFTGDSAKGVFEYLIFDVGIPKLKDLFFDLITDGSRRALFGPTGTRVASGGTQGTAYHNAYRGGPVNAKPALTSINRAPQTGSRARRRHNFDEYVLDTKAEGLDVLEKMTGVLEEYDYVRLSDLFSLLDVSTEYTDDEWGWTDLSGAAVERTREGWILDLPKPIYLKAS